LSDAVQLSSRTDLEYSNARCGHDHRGPHVHRNRVGRARPMGCLFPAIVRIRNLVESTLLTSKMSKSACCKDTDRNLPPDEWPIQAFTPRLVSSHARSSPCSQPKIVRHLQVQREPNGFVLNMTLCCRHPRSEVFHLEEIHVRPLRTPNQTDTANLWYRWSLRGLLSVNHQLDAAMDSIVPTYRPTTAKWQQCTTTTCFTRHEAFNNLDGAS
jgi:hypothetical protein